MHPPDKPLRALWIADEGHLESTSDVLRQHKLQLISWRDDLIMDIWCVHVTVRLHGIRVSTIILLTTQSLPGAEDVSTSRTENFSLIPPNLIIIPLLMAVAPLACYTSPYTSTRDFYRGTLF